MKAIFVNEGNLREYEERTKRITVENTERLLKLQKLPANKQLDIITLAEQKLEKGFALAQTLYENSQLPLSDSSVHKYPPYYHYRVQVAYIIASRARATADEVLVALLAPAVIPPHDIRYIKSITIENLIGDYGEGLCDILRAIIRSFAKSDASLGDGTKPVSQQMLDSEIYTFCEAELLKSITDEISKRQGAASEKMISEAYKFAARKHKGVNRLSGEPYILHPLYVALILAECNLDTDIIAAALLHDVIEDTHDVSLDDIENIFNARVSAFVDAVSSIDSMTLPTAYHAALYARDDLHLKNFEKLSEAVRNNPDMVGALYIKAADRIHNLLTLDTISAGNIEDTFRETESNYLKLFKQYGLNYFARIIESECLKHHNPKLYEQINESYTKLLKSSSAGLEGYTYDTRNRTTHIDGFHEILIEHVNGFNNYTYLNRLLDNQTPFDVEYRIEPYTPSEIYEQLEDAKRRRSDSPARMTKKNVLLEKFYIIVSPADDKQTASGFKSFVRYFIMHYEGGLAKKGCIITDMSYDERYDQYHFIITDTLYNRLDVILTSKKNYTESLYGSFTYTDEQPKSDEESYITVKKPDGSTMRLRSGSTVLDFAYHLHAELCLQAHSAYVNHQSCRLNTVLKNGDLVYICKSPSEVENGNKGLGKQQTPVYRANVRYISYTRDAAVQKYIIRFLANNMYGDDVLAEDVVGNEAFLEHLNHMLELTPMIMNISESEDNV